MDSITVQLLARVSNATVSILQMWFFWVSSTTQLSNVGSRISRPWGVKVERVEIKDVRVPVQLQRAMAAEAEAAREARAKVVAAEGEKKASKHLKEAALVLEESKSALQVSIFPNRFLAVYMWSASLA